MTARRNLVLVLIILSAALSMVSCGGAQDRRISFSYRARAGEVNAYQMEYRSATALDGAPQVAAQFSLNYEEEIKETTAEGVARIMYRFEPAEARLRYADGTTGAYPIEAFAMEVIRLPDGAQTIIGMEGIYGEAGLRPLAPVWPAEGVLIGESWEEVTILTLSGLPELHLIITHTLNEKDAAGRLHLSESVSLSGAGDLPFEGAVFTLSGAGETVLDAEEGRIIESRYSFVLDGESQNDERERIHQEIAFSLKAVS